MDVNIVNAEALVVGPDEILILRITEDWPEDVFSDLMDDLKRLGLMHRSLVIFGDVELTKVQKESSPGIAADYADSAE